MSATVLVLYENSDGTTFDLDYYMTKHMPMVGMRFTPFGLKGWRVIEAAGAFDDREPPFRIAAILEFDSPDQFRAAAKAEGDAVFGDVPNFTDIVPKVMLAAAVGASSPAI